MARWHVLGFTSDDIIGGWQDTRLAEACAAAWQTAGRPEALRIWQSAGQGEHFIYWYLEPSAAALLDRQRVAWRQFLVGVRGALPADAVTVLDLGARTP